MTSDIKILQVSSVRCQRGSSPATSLGPVSRGRSFSSSNILKYFKLTAFKVCGKKYGLIKLSSSIPFFPMGITIIYLSQKMAICYTAFIKSRLIRM